MTYRNLTKRIESSATSAIFVANIAHGISQRELKESSTGSLLSLFGGGISQRELKVCRFARKLLVLKVRNLTKRIESEKGYE